MKAKLEKLMYSENWNIGFCEITQENFIQNRKLNNIQWMKHPYKDRWFADPFIYDVTDSEIIVFVEECPIINPKGLLCELVLDKKTKELKYRYVLLELDTHLSYPAIIKENGKVYVYPENGASGKLNIYEYDAVNHRLVNPICILQEAVADSTIIKENNNYYLIATKFPSTLKGVYLFRSDDLFGQYKQCNEVPIANSLQYSRPGGNFFIARGSLYRPAQDCVRDYGSALSIMKVSDIENSFHEKKIVTLRPNSFRFNRGLHTLNFNDGICVIDGYGYRYPLVGRFLDGLKKFIRKIL